MNLPTQINHNAASPAPVDVSLAEALAGVEIVARMLNLSPSSALELVARVVKLKAPELSILLPSYRIDAPKSPVTAGDSPLVTFSATELLRQNGKPMTTAKFNKLALAAGYLCEVTRPSRSPGPKKYKAITPAGWLFGKNITDSTTPNETRPHYYRESFGQLLNLLT